MGGVSKDLERMLGDPKAAIRSMLLPLIVSYLVVQINLFADTSWCSGLGADASSAVSTISPITGSCRASAPASGSGPRRP